MSARNKADGLHTAACNDPSVVSDLLFFDT